MFDELAASAPAGLRYRVICEGATFTHLASAEQAGVLPGLESFKRFRAGLDGRCVEPPVATTVEEVGRYG